MGDNKRKKKADSRRVALREDYEREYLINTLDGAYGALEEATAAVNSARADVLAATSRLRAGFPVRKSKP